MLGSRRQVQEFGFGLAFSVLVDALIVCSLLVPALMHLIGPANWTLPAWLSKPSRGSRSKGPRRRRPHGTGPLDALLMAHGLIDEFHLLLTPVAAGRGQRLSTTSTGCPTCA